MDTATAEFEEAKLHSRLEQQSNLICMLKQRLDNTLSDLEQSRSLQSARQTQLEQVQRSLSTEMKQKQQLEERFHILATNHEGMIKIKDEYKSQVQTLKDSTGDATQMRVEFERKWEESENKWAGLLEVQKSRVESLELELREMICEKDAVVRDRDGLMARLEKKEGDVQDWKKKHQTILGDYTAMCAENAEKDKTVESHRSQVRELKLQLQEEKSRVKATEEKVAMLEAEAKQQEQIYKEREDELNKDAAILAMKEKVEECKKAHTSLTKEYTAYKNHSAELLDAEKKLNQQLRHLLD